MPCTCRCVFVSMSFCLCMESIVSEKIGAEDWPLYVSNDKYPRYSECLRPRLRVNDHWPYVIIGNVTNAKTTIHAWQSSFSYG